MSFLWLLISGIITHIIYAETLSVCYAQKGSKAGFTPASALLAAIPYQAFWCPINSRGCVWLSDNGTVSSTYNFMDSNVINFRLEMNWLIDKEYGSNDNTRIIYNCNDGFGDRIGFEVSHAMDNTQLNVPHIKETIHLNASCDKATGITVTIRQTTFNTDPVPRDFVFENVCMLADVYVAPSTTQISSQITNVLTTTSIETTSTTPVQLASTTSVGITSTISVGITSAISAPVASTTLAGIPSTTANYNFMLKRPKIKNIILWIITIIAGTAFMITCTAFILYCYRTNKLKYQTNEKTKKTTKMDTNDNNKTTGLSAKIDDKLAIQIISESDSVESMYDNFNDIISELKNHNSNTLTSKQSGELSPKSRASISTKISQNEGVIHHKFNNDPCI